MADATPLETTTEPEEVPVLVEVATLEADDADEDEPDPPMTTLEADVFALEEAEADPLEDAEDVEVELLEALLDVLVELEEQVRS